MIDGFSALGQYNATSWAVNKLGGENPYVWIPMPDWSRNLVLDEGGTPGEWDDMHGWSRFSGEVGLSAVAMGYGLSGTALGEAPLTQVPRVAKDGMVQMWKQVRGKAITESPKPVVEPAVTPKRPTRFPEDPKDFTPEGFIKNEYKDGEIIKWSDPKTKKALYEWNKDDLSGHYHITPDGKNRIPLPDTGDTHIPPGTIIPDIPK